MFFKEKENLSGKKRKYISSVESILFILKREKNKKLKLPKRANLYVKIKH